MTRCSALHRVAGLAMTVLASPLLAQPINDSCANATPLVLGGSVNGTTVGATVDGSAACGASSTTPDVWHTLLVLCPGDLTVYTCPASFDTVISLHSGCPGTTANEIACNDDSAYCGTAYPRASAFTVSVQPGNYLIRVSGFSGATGTYTLNAVLNPSTPANDSCANAIPIGDGNRLGCTSAATVDGSAACGASSTTPDVWYSYTPTCDGVLDVYTCPANYDTVISVHTGCPGTTSNEIACNDDSGFCGAAYPRTSYVPVPVTAGSTYLIRVSGFNGATGAFELNTHLNPLPPANDSCGNPRPIGNGAFPGSTLCATNDGLATCPVLPSPSPDVWYRYTPPCNGTLTAYTCPASFDTVVSVHTGCPGGGANQVGCNDDSAYCGTAYPLTSYVAVPVTAGVPYLIRVGGYGVLNGTFTLNTSLTACCYANCDNSTNLPVLNVNDFVCFQAEFAASHPYADCDHSGNLNVNDFVCFQSAFAAGCQ